MTRTPLAVLLLDLLPCGQLAAQEHMHDQDQGHREGHDAAVKAVASLLRSMG